MIIVILKALLANMALAGAIALYQYIKNDKESTESKFEKKCNKK